MKLPPIVFFQNQACKNYDYSRGVAEAHNHLGLILSKQLETIENIFDTSTLSFFHKKSKKMSQEFGRLKIKMHLCAVKQWQTYLVDSSKG